MQLVLERNSFYKEGAQRLMLVVILLIIASVLLVFTLIYKVAHPAQPQYFAATPNGRILQIYPLSSPVVSDSYVLQWAANKVRLSFAQDYLHWHQQLEDVQSSFTPEGWRYFVGSLKRSNNLKTLTNYKMVSNAEIIGSPVIEQKAVIRGHYTWKIKLSILVTYNNIHKKIPMPMDITLIVIRMPVQNYPSRIAINNFLPILAKSNNPFTM